ncbi:MULTISPECIES: sensor histidine kinase [unclassified Anabaena]|uniref:GAF domain-containing sensor histidine kinase n=1 Tax=unclassified Anabaena TaxID=2619674 RepID=UPI0039C6888D
MINRRLTHLPQLLNEMAQEVVDAIDHAQFCLIALCNPQTTQLELTAKAGVDVDKLFFLMLNGREGRDRLWSTNENLISSDVATHPDTGFLEQVFATGAPQLFQATQEDEMMIEGYTLSLCPIIPIFSAFTPAAMYAVAIDSAQAGRLGVMAIGNWENPQAFDATSQNLVNAVAEVVAIAINNASMMQVLADQEARLATQTEIILEQNCQLEKTQHQMQIQNLQLLAAANLKSQFLATTSHELRTPLNVILGLSQVLLRQRTATLSEQQEDMVRRVLSNGNHLLEIIDDMLYLSTVQSGCISLQPEEFNLSTLVLTTVAEYRSLAAEKCLNLQVEINLDDPLLVNDSARLRQVLVKLLLNAIKFTETGSITIKAWAIAPDKMAIAVQDSGVGIAESDLEYIFEQFRQVDQTNTRKYGGTGLGLAITKSLVEIMQGTISVTSQPGEGSTFCVELPHLIRS